MAEYKINPEAERIAIPNNKLKVYLFLFVTLLIFVGGLWVITHQNEFQDMHDGYRSSRARMIIAGYLAVIAGGLCVISFVLILIKSKPGLVIDDKGVTIGAYGSSNIVSWVDIKDFEIGAFNNVAFINIHLNDTDKFIKAQKSVAKRKLMSFNISQTGAAISINTTLLKCDFNQLYDLLCDRLKEFKAAEKSTRYGVEA